MQLVLLAAQPITVTQCDSATGLDTISNDGRCISYCSSMVSRELCRWRTRDRGTIDKRA